MWRAFGVVLLGFSAGIFLPLLVVFFDPVSAPAQFLIEPGFIFAPYATAVVPTQLIYWVAPEGGGPAYVAIAALCALLVWGCVFSCLALLGFYALHDRRKSNHVA